MLHFMRREYDTLKMSVIEEKKEFWLNKSKAPKKTQISKINGTSKDQDV